MSNRRNRRFSNFWINLVISCAVWMFKRLRYCQHFISSYWREVKNSKGSLQNCWVNLVFWGKIMTNIGKVMIGRIRNFCWRGYLESILIFKGCWTPPRTRKLMTLPLIFLIIFCTEFCGIVIFYHQFFYFFKFIHLSNELRFILWWWIL